MEVDWNRLRVFYYVYRHKSIQDAARKLHVTQPAVSQSLKALEEEMGNSLFTRLKKSLLPTAAGEELFATVSPFYTGLQQRLDNIQRSQKNPAGWLRVGAPIDYGIHQMIPVFQKFREHHKEVYFYQRLGMSQKLLQLLMQNALDFAVTDRIALPDSSPITMEPLIRLRFSLVTASSKHKSLTRFEDLIEQNFVSYSMQGFELKYWFKEQFGKTADDLKIVLASPNVHGLRQAARQDMGMALVPSYLVEKDIREKRLFEIEGPKPPLENDLVLAYLKDKPMTLTESTFLNFLRHAKRT